MAAPVEEALVLVTLPVAVVLARPADLRCSFLESRYFPFLKMQNELLAEESREETEARLDLLPRSRYCLSCFLFFWGVGGSEMMSSAQVA